MGTAARRNGAPPGLIAKVYEGKSTRVCQMRPGMPGPRSGTTPMKILAVITDPDEVKKIVRYLVKTGKPPPGLDPSSLN